MDERDNLAPEQVAKQVAGTLLHFLQASRIQSDDFERVVDSLPIPTRPRPT